MLLSRTVPFDLIDFSGGWNLHPWELYTLSGDLASSFSRTGILHPPILLTGDDNRLEIVCGFKRLLFVSSLSSSQEIACLVLAKHTDPAVILDIVLTDQSLGRPLSIAEKARFLEISSNYLEKRDIVNAYGERLMMDRRPSTLALLAKILRQPPLLITESHRGILQEKMVIELLRLPAEADRVALVTLFKRLGMGEGKQRKFFPLIRDLAFRDETSIAAYLEQPSIQAILDHPDMNNPQKIQHLGAFVQQQLNPLAIDAEIDFAREVNSLNIPENCTIAHSPSFEKDEVTLSIIFENLSACRDWMPTLTRSRT